MYSKALWIDINNPIILKGSGPLSYTETQTVHWKVVEESGDNIFGYKEHPIVQQPTPFQPFLASIT